MRGSWYRVRVRSGAAPRLGLCSPLDRPPQAARSGADHRRVSLPARRLIRGVLAAPGSPWAVCSLLAACGPQLQARSGLRRRALQSSRGSAPLRSMPRAGPPRPARLSARSPSDASSHQASLPQPASLSPEPSPQLKSAINFPSLPPPCSAPATQTPPPDAPSLTSRLAQPPPARPRPVAHPPSPWAPGSLNPPPLAPLGPPEALQSPARCSGHEYFSAGEAALCRCCGTDCCGNPTNPTNGQGGSGRKRPQVRAGAVLRRASLSRRGVGAWPASRPPASPAERGNAPGKLERASGRLA